MVWFLGLGVYVWDNVQLLAIRLAVSAGTWRVQLVSIQRMMAWSLVPILRLRSIVLAGSTLIGWCVPAGVGEEEEGVSLLRLLHGPLRRHTADHPTGLLLLLARGPRQTRGYDLCSGSAGTAL